MATLSPSGKVERLKATPGSGHGAQHERFWSSAIPLIGWWPGSPPHASRYRAGSQESAQPLRYTRRSADSRLHHGHRHLAAIRGKVNGEMLPWAVQESRRCRRGAAWAARTLPFCGSKMTGAAWRPPARSRAERPGLTIQAAAKGRDRHERPRGCGQRQARRRWQQPASGPHVACGCHARHNARPWSDFPVCRGT